MIETIYFDRSTALYCNWHRGPHGKKCANPTQCYCSCHSTRQLTDFAIKKQILQHENSIAKLKEVLNKRADTIRGRDE